MILIELSFDSSSDDRENVVQLAARTTVATHQEEGCVLYRFTNDLERPNRFVLTELWETEEHLKAHFAGEAFKNFWAEQPGGEGFVSNAWQGSLVSYVPPNPTP